MLNNAYYKSYQLQLEGDVHKKLDKLQRGTVALEEKIKQLLSKNDGRSPE